MPISDEVIELVPAGKSKSKVIIFIVAAAVGLALAATFLILYLLKPNVEEHPPTVNSVTMSSTEFFTAPDENGNEISYAAVGNTYTVTADISVDNGASGGIRWEITPSNAVTEVKNPAGAKSAEGSASLTFIPNLGYHNTVVTITARSSSDIDKYQTVKFTIVDQGAESIDFTTYQVKGEGAGATNIVANSIVVPYYPNVKLTDGGNKVSNPNKTYQVNFVQRGKYNPSTGEYLDVVKNEIEKGVHLNDVSVKVKSGNSDVVSINNGDTDADRFVFIPQKEGKVVIEVTANVNNASVENLSATIEIEVKSNETLGYMDNIYVFSRPIVDDKFIASVVDDYGNVSTQLLSDKIKLLNTGDDGKEYADGDPRKVTFNSTITLPYMKDNYENIFNHVLVTPTSIQYDAKTKKLKDNWFKDIELTTSTTGASGNTRALTIATSGGKTSVSTRALAGTSNSEGAVKCTLTFTDGKSGGMRFARTVNINIVVKNSEGTARAEVGTQKFSGSANNPVQVVPNDASSLFIDYENIVMGNFDDKDVTNIIEYGYMSNKLILEFDPQIVTVKRSGADSVLEPNKILELRTDSMKFGAANNTSTSAQRKGTIEFIVTTNKDLQDGETFTITYHKLGSFMDEDSSWSKIVHYKVNKVAAEARFLNAENSEENAVITGIMTRDGKSAGRFVRTSDTSADLYVQNRTSSNTTFDELYDFTSLITADGSYTTAIAECKANTTAGAGIAVFNVIPATKKLTFAGNARLANATMADAEIVVNVLSGSSIIGTFKFNIYTVDAITHFDSIAGETRNYSGANLNAAGVTIPSANIKVGRVMSGASASYNKTLSVDLSYKDGGNDVYFERTSANGITKFSYKGTVVYQYENYTLTPVVDLFAFGYNNNKLQFNEVKLYFRLPNDEYYFVDETDESILADSNGKPYGMVYCTFYRQADGVAVASSSSFADATVLELNKADDANNYYNVGSQIELHISSVIHIDGENGGTDIIARASNMVGYLDSYIEIDSDVYYISNIEQYGTPSNASLKRCTDVVFTAPTITEEGSTEKEHSLDLHYENNTEKYAFTVQNKARSLASIGIWADKDCTVAIDPADFEFGSYIGKTANYTKTIYIKLNYVQYNSNQLSLEPAILTVPDFLSVTVGTADVSGSSLTLDPRNLANVYDETPNVVYECEIKLASEATQKSGNITLYQSSAPNGDGVKAVVAASAGTGLGGIRFVEDDHSHDTDSDRTVTINVPVMLTADDVKKIQGENLGRSVLSFKTEYLTRTGSKYPGLLYDYNSGLLEVDYSGKKDGALPAVNGLTFIDNTQNGGTSVLRISQTDIRTLDGTFVITFTDKSGGAESENVFTINIHVIVTVDIFALKTNTEKYVVETKNLDGESAVVKLPVNVIYNEGEEHLQPERNTKENVDVFIVKAGKQYNGNDIFIEKDTDALTYKLVVKGTVLAVEDTYVRLQYGDIVKDIPVVVESLAHYIDFASDSIDKTNAGDGYNAVVVISNSNNAYSLAAVVKNNGTNDIKESKASEIVYAVYDDKECTQPAENASVSDTGILTITPSSAIGVVYFRATYVDNGGTGKTYTLNVTVAYYVQITEVTLNTDEIADVVNGYNITLYYANENAYTQIDLAGHITATHAYGTNFGSGLENKLEYVISATQSVDVNGAVISPKKADDNVMLTITARYKDLDVAGDVYKNTVCENIMYKVVVRSLTAPKLDPLSGDVDISTGSTATVGVHNIIELVPFDSTFAFDGSVNGVTVTKEDGAYRYTFAAGHTAPLGAHTYAGKLLYTLKDGSSAVAVSDISVGGKPALYMPVSYTLNVKCEAYQPEFDLVTTVAGKDAVIAPNAPFTVTEGASYKLVLTNKQADIVYSAQGTNNLLTFGTESNGVIPVTLDSRMSGAVNVTVSATLNGNTLKSQTQSYSFNYGLNVTSELQIYDAANKVYVPFTGSTKAIDYTTDKVKFRLKLKNVDMAAATAHITVSGGEKADMAAGADYVDITVDTVGTLLIGGYVEIGGRVVYLDSYSVSLTATAPDFAFGTVASPVYPNSSVTFAINAAQAFMGEYSVSYELLSGGGMVTLSGNRLTVLNNVDTNGVAVVRATVTVSSGVFADKTYTVTKEINIEGRSKPIVEWEDGTSYTLANTDSHKFVYNVLNGSWLTSTDYSVAVQAGDTVLIEGQDFTYTSGVLQINQTAATKAGGTITLTATLTVNSKIHQGHKSVAKIVVTVLPSIDTAAVTIGNAAGTTDIANKITVNNNGTATGFIKDSDVVVKSLKFKPSGVDYNDRFEINGSKLTLKNNVTTGGTYKFDVEVAIVTGAYAGKTMQGEIDVTVASMPTVNTLNADWNGTGYSDINVPNSFNGLSSVTNVTVISHNSAVTVDNGKITVRNDANTYLSDSADPLALQAELEYRITADGLEYYATGELIIPSVAITVTITVDENGDPQAALTKYVNDTFTVTFAADNGFTAVITNIKVVAPSNAEEMSYNYGGNKVMFSTPAAANGGNYSVEITYSAGGHNKTYPFTVAVVAPTSSAAYTATDTDNTDMVVGEKRTVKSVWSYNSASYSTYKYAVSLAISVPTGTTLSTYFESVKLYSDDPNSSSADATASLNDSSATLEFTKVPGGGWNAYRELNSFYLVMVFKNTAAIAKCPITVTFRASNKASTWGAQTQNITLTYNVQVVNKYTVTFDPQNGTVGDSTITVTNGGKYGILPTPTRNLYTFGGWYTQPNGGGSLITKESKVDLSGNQTLYAKWNAVSNIITLIPDGGSISGNNTATVVAGGKYTLPSTNQVTRTGYTFDGWYTLPNGGEAIANNDNADANTVYTVLYAKWTAKQITVTFDANGGSVAPATKPYNYDSAYGTLPTPTRDGYDFLGWFTEQNGGNLVYPDTVVKSETNVTLYAHWQAKTYTYTVTLMLHNGADNIVFNSVSGEFTMHTLITPTREGYDFDGWYDQAEGGSEVKNSLTIAKDTTLHAHWTEKTPMHTVTLYINDGTDDVLMMFDNAYGEFAVHIYLAPTREGYEFLGWSKQQIGGAIEKDVLEVDDDIKLYAQWKQLCTVTFYNNYDSDDSSVYVECKDVSDTLDLKLVNDPIRAGYIFDGWFTEATGGEKRENSITVNANVQLYAHWTEITEPPEQGNEGNNDQP